MVANECMYLANYKAGCRIVKLFHNGSLITLERVFLVDTKESPDSATVQKKKQLDEFMKNQRMAAKDLLVSTFECNTHHINLTKLLKGIKHGRSI